MTKLQSVALMRTVKYGALAGVAGGIAEIVWILFYGAVANGDSAAVARAVTATVTPILPRAALFGEPVLSGILVHMALAVAMGVALVFAWRSLAGRWPRRVNEYAFMAGALTIVWTMNFFVVLPLINPDFVQLVPYSASLASKLLFGLAAAVMLRRTAADRLQLIPIRMRLS